MALPKEPRQKMINIMYLVLTALLALNVSAEILNAFKTVDSSLDRTNTTINNSTTDIMTSFDELLADEKTRVKAQEWYPKAKNVIQLSTGMYDYLEQLRQRILKEAGYDPSKGDTTYKEDDQDVATRILVDGPEGKKLYDAMSSYRQAMLSIDPKVKDEFQRSLQVDVSMPRVQNKSNRTWQAAYFHMVPTVAALTMLRKFQNDVKTSENRVVAFLHSQVGKVSIRYDAFEAIVGQNSKYLMPGQELEITAGLGAFSRSKLPNVSIGGSGVQLNEKGMAVWKTAATTIGTHTIPVTVSFIDQDGNTQTRTYNVEYTVGQANASIALDKMNVLYIGVDNPISIAASGGGDDKVVATITGGGGSLRKVGAGKYIARVNSPSDDCRITVSVDGKVAGASQFRVRTIPDPVATVGGYASGENVPAGAFKAQSGVGAYIKDFPFDLKYSVTGFTLTADTDDGDIVEAQCSGNTWNAAAQNIIRGLKAGKLVTIDNIRAVGQDGRSRKLPSLVYYIK